MQARVDTDQMAWNRASFTGSADYTIDFSAAERSELAQACERLRANGKAKSPESLTKADFGLATLAPRLESAYQQVRAGRGFVVLRGLPLDQGLEGFMTAVWAMGLHFGGMLSQSAEGERIGHVLDSSKDEATPRYFRTNIEARMHTDNTAMISLACWHKAQEGGASFVSSSVTVHDEIKARAPHLLERLYRGYHYHRLGEEADGQAPVTPYRMPVFTERARQLSCRYQRAGIVAGQRAANLTIDETDIAALDLFDNIAKAPENRIAFFLERGDMIILNNYTLMHSRTTFKDYPEPERRRHLVRLWIDQPGFREVPRELYLFDDVNGVPGQPGKKCTFDFKKLFGNDPAAGGLPNMGFSEDEVIRA
jgi:alpha-ketoglutarate-dependent taurine dioxygenase